MTPPNMNKLLHSIFFLYICLISPNNPAAANDIEQRPLIVFAASSTQNVLMELAKTFSAQHKVKIPIFSFGGSAIMARQINAGAKADLFISANRNWTHYLQENGKVRSQPYTIAANRLVLAVPKKDQYSAIAALDNRSLGSFLAGKRFAVANPDTAPAGEYTKHLLESLNVWNDVRDNIALSPNVRQTLRLIEYGGIPGFIYMSDATISTGVRVIYQSPPNGIEINYTAAPVGQSTHQSTDFIDFLKSSSAAPIWEKYGFVTIASN